MNVLLLSKCFSLREKDQTSWTLTALAEHIEGITLCPETRRVRITDFRDSIWTVMFSRIYITICSTSGYRVNDHMTSTECLDIENQLAGCDLACDMMMVVTG